MSDILTQLWDTAQKGFVQSYSQPAQGANLEPIDSRLKFKKMGPPSSSESSPSEQSMSGNQVNLGNSAYNTDGSSRDGGGYQSLTQQAISSGIGGY